MVRPSILIRHVAVAVLAGIGLMCLLLLGIYTLIELVREARALAGDYGGVQLSWYLLQTTPRRLYDVFPFAALVGTLLGLGRLAANGELVAMRAAGFDRRQLMLTALGAVAVSLVVLLAVAETAMPQWETQARAEREQARTGQVHLGRWGALWLRDGNLILRIGFSAWREEASLEFGDVRIYQLDRDMQPTALIHAARARHDLGAWHLDQVVRQPLGLSGRSVAEHLDALSLDSALREELFAASVSRPRLLGAADLARMMSFLEANGLDAGPYRSAFWGRLYYPLNVIAMVLVGLPLVFWRAASAGWGINLFAGFSLGLAFFIVQRLVQGLAQVWWLPVWLTLLIPVLVFFILTFVLARQR